jgi:hypothetical protein
MSDMLAKKRQAGISLAKIAKNAKVRKGTV